MATYEEFLPVNLLTGFLGSGKTTLLKRLLESPELANTAVLINEFGEIGLDHLLLETVDDEFRQQRSGPLRTAARRLAGSQPSVEKQGRTD